MRKINGVRNGVGIGGIDRDKLVPFPHFQFAADAQIGARSCAACECRLCRMASTKGSALPSRMGKFQVVQLDDRVVDAATDQGGEKMFGGGNQHALFHQAGGVADPGHVSAHSLQFKPVEISAAKNHARSGGRGQYPQLDGSTAVQSYSAAVDGCADCLFVYQTRSAVCCLMTNLSCLTRLRLWLICHSGGHKDQGCAVHPTLS